VRKISDAALNELSVASYERSVVSGPLQTRLSSFEFRHSFGFLVSEFGLISHVSSTSGFDSFDDVAVV
jgi:hypothetical protein